MARLLWLLLATGVAPFALALARLTRRPSASDPDILASALLCALAFNLTFFWQELWLVLPKALVPGLHPILYHNDHDWIGHAPIAELLQGSGAVATMMSGLAALALMRRRQDPTLALFWAWMAFQGLFQSLSQGAIGCVLPGNDVGRALAYLGIGETTKAILLIGVVAAMAWAGRTLALLWPTALERRSRGFAMHVALPALIAIALIVPFRVPRDPVEVVLIPVVVVLIGLGWLLLGATTLPTFNERPAPERPKWPIPAIALGALLAVFQLVLRPGIRF